MTTTEWVERYNLAFAEAGLGPRTMYECRIQDGRIAGEIRSTDDEIRHSYPCANSESYAIPPNPSPFEPKEVVDDGQEGTGALNRKE